MFILLLLFPLKVKLLIYKGLTGNNKIFIKFLHKYFLYTENVCRFATPKFKNAMVNSNLRNILESKNIKITTAGEKLFPKSKNPYVAIKRVIDRSQSLKEEQIIALSELTETPIENLFRWTGPKASKDIISFSFGPYVAELNTQTWETHIYSKGVIVQALENDAKGVRLSSYLAELNEAINKIK